MAYGLADVVQQRRLIDQSEASEAYKRVSAAKLDALLGLCETAGCRRVRLLDYFGESSTPCGNCDTCLVPPATFDATIPARKALSAIYRTGQRFGALHLIDVLRGKDSERVARWDHHKLGVFGIGADLDETAWRSVFRQLVALGFVRVDHAAHGGLQLTEAARPVLKGDEPVAMRQARVRSRVRGRASSGRAAGPSSLATADGALLERLKAWRLAESRAQALPAYVILHDRTLAEIAAQRPRHLEKLAGISGIGAKKLERYGPALIEIVMQENAVASRLP
jgi:ATP-dependent DNA helicase RecQ